MNKTQDNTRIEKLETEIARLRIENSRLRDEAAFWDAYNSLMGKLAKSHTAALRNEILILKEINACCCAWPVSSYRIIGKGKTA